MIRNLIFDFGQVLARFEPDEMIKPYLSDPADRETVARVAFDRCYWDRLDNGTMSEEEAADLIAPSLPERLRGPMRQTMLNWYYHRPPIKGMEELIDRTRRDFGVSVYLLSNISRNFAAHADLYPVLRKMDGRVFSAEVGLTKPDPAIFEYTLRKFGLNPIETLFIDDAPRNLVGAATLGIRGYRFDGDVARLETFLRETLRG